MQHDGEKTYQGVVLTRTEQNVTFFRSHNNVVVENVLTCLKDRVKVQHSTLFSHILTLTTTQRMLTLLM